MASAIALNLSHSDYFQNKSSSINIFFHFFIFRINNLESSSSYLEAKCHELEGCKTQTLHDMKVKHDETELKLQEAEEQLKLLEKEYEDKLESEKMEV